MLRQKANQANTKWIKRSIQNLQIRINKLVKWVWILKFQQDDEVFGKWNVAKDVQKWNV